MNEQLVHLVVASPVLLCGVDLRVLGSCGIKLSMKQIHRSDYRSCRPILVKNTFWFLPQSMYDGVLSQQVMVSHVSFNKVDLIDDMIICIYI